MTLKISQWSKASRTRNQIAAIAQGADPVCVDEDQKVKRFPIVVLPKEKLVNTIAAGTLLMLLD